MNRDEYVLAAMAMAGRDPLSPVQVQKYFFILDKNVSDLMGGSQFEFEPYDFGPFDKAVYEALDSLRDRGLVEIVGDLSRGVRMYRLTENGFHRAEDPIKGIPANVRTYAQGVAEWMRPLSFSQLVSAIYYAYPDMKVNSIFQARA